MTFRWSKRQKTLVPSKVVGRRFIIFLFLVTMVFTKSGCFGFKVQQSFYHLCESTHKGVAECLDLFIVVVLFSVLIITFIQVCYFGWYYWQHHYNYGNVHCSPWARILCSRAAGTWKKKGEQYLIILGIVPSYNSFVTHSFKLCKLASVSKFICW